MRKIEVDEEVYTYLQNKAIPYVETNPNLTLRRLFNLNGEMYLETGIPNKTSMFSKKRKKTSLSILISDGSLDEGQTVDLVDYRGKILSGYRAQISGNSLLFEGRAYSMSKLAEICLKKEGYNSNSVQGPARWYTSDGRSIFEIWKNYLKRVDK
jgi:hypothetical protein